MQNSQELVWYVCYGSNLLEERFLCYIRGGSVPDRTFINRGCSDTTLPRRNQALEIPYALYFSGYSQVYEGGVGFLTDVPGITPTKARAYLVTAEQFWEVIAQENALNHAVQPRPLSVIRTKGKLLLDDIDQNYRLYNTVLYCGELENYPMLSFTTSETLTQAVPPSKDYLITIAAGLRQSHRMSTTDIADYLIDLSGIASNYTYSELLNILDSSVELVVTNDAIITESARLT
ncbi:MAG TPA: hypothetical protein VLG92_04960 [Candidatus Saccharimonadia bacterium]|nr:hypothetical protein [Candidatus Saccharimonadia bacterium]